MTSEVQWVLNQLASVVSNVSEPLRRVNRDESMILETGVRDISGELRQANYVGATHANRVTTPVGTEYDHEVETTVGVRVTGLDHSEYGHIDPTGVDGVPFDDADNGGLVQRTQTVLLEERTYPGAGPAGTTYTHLKLADYNPSSSAAGDYYQYDYDVIFHGFETLP